MSEDAAALTRWLFEDFKRAYDVKLGRKPQSDAKRESLAGEVRSESMGNAQSGAPVSEANGSNESNGSGKKVRELAPYEKFTASQGRDRAPVANGLAALPLEKPGWMKPLPDFPSLETTALAESIMQDIVKGDLDVQWDSIQGLENAKRLLKEAVVMPIKYPHYFTGLLTPWKGILLFGPPGTGKVLLVFRLTLGFAFFSCFWFGNGLLILVIG
jgi:hypothetical protein